MDDLQGCFQEASFKRWPCRLRNKADCLIKSKIFYSVFTHLVSLCWFFIYLFLWYLLEWTDLLNKKGVPLPRPSEMRYNHEPTVLVCRLEFLCHKLKTALIIDHTLLYTHLIDYCILIWKGTVQRNYYIIHLIYISLSRWTVVGLTVLKLSVSLQCGLLISMSSNRVWIW